MKSYLLIAVFGLLWIAGSLFGLRRLIAYEATPGAAAAPASAWPAASAIPLASDRDTLVVVAHPQCPCTRATLGELSALMARCQGRLAVQVLFYKPSGFAAGWEKTDLWRQAVAIPGVRAVRDDDGVEAGRFGARTSGQTLLFDPSGRLLFKGGITAGRGHAGDNAGRAAVTSLVLTGKADRHETPVFGCAISSSEAGG